MIFIGDYRTGQFRKMVHPYTIDCSTESDCVLYVQDAYGTFYTLTFASHDALVECMKTLCNTGRTTCKCKIDYYHEPQSYDNSYEREISLQDLEIEYER